MGLRRAVTNNSRWVLEFERELTEYLGVPTGTLCDGKTAMMVMLRAAGIAGGEVIADEQRPKSHGTPGRSRAV
jgi:dTDP-4-amino-4,6-dideoxygalactose transaminase